jgi:uncharacterized lipoprotein YmbA
MRAKRWKAALVLAPALAGVVLTGCVLKRSNDARVFVLEPLAARGVAAADTQPVAVVGILPVGVPGWIDRPQVTTRVGDSQVLADEFSRWGEPIAKGIQRVVAENLAALLPSRRVITAPWAGYEPVVHEVDITITELARQSDGTVLLEAHWAIIGKGRTTLVQRRSSHRSPTPAPGADGIVEASSRVLEALSREIAQALEALPLPPAEETPRN